MPALHRLCAARHARRGLHRSRPLAPRVPFQRVLAQGLELLRELAAHRHGEGRGHAHVMERARRVVEAEQERPHALVAAVLVPAEPRHHAVRGAHVLDLDHRALARLVERLLVLGDHAVEAGALEAMEPVLRDAAIAGARGEVDAPGRAGQRLLQLRRGAAAWGRPRRSSSPRASRSKATNEAGIAVASLTTRDAAGCRRNCSGVEVEAAVADDDDLPVDHAAGGEVLPEDGRDARGNSGRGASGRGSGCTPRRHP